MSTETSHRPPLRFFCFCGLPVGGHGSVWGWAVGGSECCWGKEKPVPDVTISVWLENTQSHGYLCTQVGHIQENRCFYTAWLITAPCCFQVCLKSQIQLIAIPGSGTGMNSSRKVCPRSQPGDKKKHRKESEEALCCFGLPAVPPYKERNPSRLGTD